MAADDFYQLRPFVQFRFCWPEPLGSGADLLTATVCWQQPLVDSNLCRKQPCTLKSSAGEIRLDFFFSSQCINNLWLTQYPYSEKNFVNSKSSTILASMVRYFWGSVHSACFSIQYTTVIIRWSVEVYTIQYEYTVQNVDFPGFCYGDFFLVKFSIAGRVAF